MSKEKKRTGLKHEIIYFGYVIAVKENYFKNYVFILHRMQKYECPTHNK